MIADNTSQSLKRQRTASDSVASSSSQSALSPGDSSSAGPLTPSTTEDQTRSSKYAHLDGREGVGRPPVVMRCFLPPHTPIPFTAYGDYDVHYQKYHSNRCLECGKNFPSEHYVGLHIAENHDPLNEVRRARGEKTVSFSRRPVSGNTNERNQYACFVEGCEKVCSEPQRRRWHAIAKHQFPKNYDFFIVNDGIDKRSSMLRPGYGHRRRSSAATNSVTPGQRLSKSTQEGEPASATVAKGADGTMTQENDRSISQGATEGGESANDIGMDYITKSMSTLKFVPPSVRFGRGKRRGGLSRR